MLDDGEADDKIIAVLANDNMYADTKEISELPDVLVERLRHYFSTYKLIPGQEDQHQVSIGPAYGSEQAGEVIKAALADYEEEFGG